MLSRSEAKSAVPVLIEALQDKDETVSRAAAVALAEIGPDIRLAVPALIERLKDEHREIRLAAAEALQAIIEQATQSLKKIDSLKSKKS